MYIYARLVFFLFLVVGLFYEFGYNFSSLWVRILVYLATVYQKHML